MDQDRPSWTYWQARMPVDFFVSIAVFRGISSFCRSARTQPSMRSRFPPAELSNCSTMTRGEYVSLEGRAR